MHPVLDAAVIRLGGVERFTEAVNAAIRSIEAGNGVPPERSRATVHPTTVRRWLRLGERPRYPLVAAAICEVAGRGPGELWPTGNVDDMDRREFLTAAGALGAAAAGGLLSVLGELGAAPSPDVTAYTDQARALWLGCWQVEPTALAYQAADHAEAARRLLPRAQGEDRRRIADAAGLSTILVGRVAFFDLGRPQVAAAVWEDAARRLEGSSDHPLLACLHGHMAFVPGWAGRPDLAQAHLHLAAGHARRGGGPGLRSWLHAVAAECLARSGRVADALLHVERARETLAAGGAHDDPWWLDFYDARRLDGFDAAVGLATAHAVLSRDATQRDARHARDRVERALRLLPQPAAGPGLTPQDCVTLLDRSIGTALVGDDDGALRLVETAAHPLGRRPYHAAEVRLDDIAEVLPASRLPDLQEIERAYLRVA